MSDGLGPVVLLDLLLVLLFLVTVGFPGLGGALSPLAPVAAGFVSTVFLASFGGDGGGTAAGASCGGSEGCFSASASASSPCASVEGVKEIFLDGNAGAVSTAGDADVALMRPSVDGLFFFRWVVVGPAPSSSSW